MKNKNNTLFRMSVHFVLWLALLVVSSCDSFVDVPQPNSQLNSDAVFADYSTATAAMKDVYAKMRDTGLLNGNVYGMSNLLGQYTDELTSYQNAVSITQPFYTNSLTVSNPTIQELWSITYNQIYSANAVIAGVANSSGLNMAQKNQLTGEALFIRALLHSYLAGLFGGCPYVVATDYRLNSTVSRLSQMEIYDLCISDLEQAAILLPVTYISAERIRPNQFAAKALLARMYLYTGQWAEAGNSASAVLNETSLYVWETNLDNTFLKNCNSTLWQFAAGAGYTNTQEGALFIFNAGPPTDVALSTAFYNEFEIGDQRKNHWTRAITNGTDTWYHSYKYKKESVATGATECSIMLRLAEQYLIRAEARAHEGNLSGAKEDLNLIRMTAGLGPTTAQTATELLAAVFKERRSELFTEIGHRFFDLQRTGQLDEVLTPAKAGWNTTDGLWPVPQSELLLNPNLLPQNEGY